MANIVSIQLSNYVKPDIQEQIGKEWVLYGKNNLFFDYINDRKNGSPTNSAVLNAYDKLLYGRGVTVKGKDEVYVELNEIFAKREQQKCMSDYYRYGQYAMQFLRAKGGDKKIAQILHLPFEKLGVEKADDDGNINGVYYSDNWSNQTLYKPQRYPCLLYTSPSPRDGLLSRMPSSA